MRFGGNLAGNIKLQQLYSIVMPSVNVGRSESLSLIVSHLQRTLQSSTRTHRHVCCRWPVSFPILPFLFPWVVQSPSGTKKQPVCPWLTKLVPSKYLWNYSFVKKADRSQWWFSSRSNCTRCSEHPKEWWL